MRHGRYYYEIRPLFCDTALAEADSGIGVKSKFDMVTEESVQMSNFFKPYLRFNQNIPLNEPCQV